jgi:hypothetical protein
MTEDYSEYPLSVKAPVIMDATTEEGVKPLWDFARGLLLRANTEAAAMEAARLKPYFGALSAYLARAADGSATLHDEVKATHKALNAPDKLCEMFNGMAKATGNTILSGIAIAPHDIRAEGAPAARLFSDMTLNHSFRYGAYEFRFGFVEVFRDGEKPHQATSSVSVPIFTLEPALLNAIAPHAPEKMLEKLQSVITALNHDMLHHFHSPAINRAIAHNFDPDYREGPVYKEWFGTPAVGPLRLEPWSQLTHGKTLKDETLAAGVKKDADIFFDELARISGALPAAEAAAAADYFGMALLQSFTRALPLTHPLIAHCLERLEQADPLDPAARRRRDIFILGKKALPENQDWKEDAIIRILAAEKKFEEVTPEDVLEGALRAFSKDGEMRNVLKDWAGQGLKFHRDPAALSYRDLKLLQLAALSPSDARTHVPASANKFYAEVQAGADSAALGLFHAVKRTVAAAPK